VFHQIASYASSPFDPSVVVFCNSPSKTKTHSSDFERMGSSIDNPGRYISLSSEGSWIDPLQFRIPHLLGYPPMDYVTQDISIIAFLELIVKSNKGRCVRIEVSLNPRFFLLF